MKKEIPDSLKMLATGTIVTLTIAGLEKAAGTPTEATIAFIGTIAFTGGLLFIGEKTTKPDQKVPMKNQAIILREYEEKALNGNNPLLKLDTYLQEKISHIKATGRYVGQSEEDDIQVYEETMLFLRTTETQIKENIDKKVGNKRGEERRACIEKTIFDWRYDKEKKMWMPYPIVELDCTSEQVDNFTKEINFPGIILIPPDNRDEPVQKITIALGRTAVRSIYSAPRLPAID